jgi:hypothetical protein
MVEENDHDDHFKRPGAREVNTGVHVELGPVKEAVKDPLVEALEGNVDRMLCAPEIPQTTRLTGPSCT